MKKLSRVVGPARLLDDGPGALVRYFCHLLFAICRLKSLLEALPEAEGELVPVNATV
jgi:hypothetical protein